MNKVNKRKETKWALMIVKYMLKMTKKVTFNLPASNLNHGERKIGIIIIATTIIIVMYSSSSLREGKIDQDQGKH